MTHIRDPKSVSLNPTGGIAVVCDDGSVWFNHRDHDGNYGQWASLPPIPGTKHAWNEANKEERS